MLYQDQSKGIHYRPGGSVNRAALPPQDQGRYSYANEERIIADLVERLDIRTQYAIDIAAGDGMHMSNTYRLFEKGWGGLVVEWDAERFTRLANNYRPFTTVGIARCQVTPPTVCQLLAAHGAPRMPSVLSLDIDSYDHAVLEMLLREYRPQIACVEINEKIPPPIRFTVLYDPTHRWATDHFYGQSISQLYQLCQSFGYVIATLEFNNAMLIPAELAARQGIRGLTDVEAYQGGYLNRPERHSLFPWNANLEHLHGLPPQKALAEVHHFFSLYRGKFHCEI